MSKAAIYVRVSTHYQIDKDSLPHQKKELKNYCHYALNITEHEIFEDAGYSGKNTDRPAYQRMMEGIRSGKFTHLVVYKIDRISRNLLDFAGMYEELKKYNVTFVSKQEQFDTSTAMGEAMLKITLVFAELERNITSERVTDIMIGRAAKGLWNGARMPIGYKWSEEKKYPIIDEEEAKTVKLIYDEYERIQSTTLITRSLNNSKVKTKRGGSWTSKTVADVLRNPFYIGTYRYNYRESARGKKKPESEWIIVENNHPGLIKKEQWELVNKIMDSHNISKDTSGFRGKHIHIFSGVLKCGKCGNNFNANRVDKARLSGFKPTTYNCSRRITMKDCDNKMASDVVVGPFVFNYMANMLKAQRDITKIGGIQSLKKILLSGECFKNVSDIDNDGLQAFYNAMIYKYIPDMKYNPNIENNKNIVSVDNGGYQIVSLQKEKEKTERALERLKQLYLFDDEAMSEKDYIKSRNDLITSRDDLNRKIDELQKSNSSTPGSDISFILKASNFIVSQKLLSKKYIDYPELSLTCDNQIMKDFINSTIEWITVKNAKVIKIEFKNGLIHEFKYIK